MAHSTLRGHDIEFVDEVWRYVDTKEPTAYSKTSRRSCGRCGEVPTPEGHDACFGTLPGVKHACCGHGYLPKAYVTFEDGRRLSGQEALDFAEGQR